uniref:Metallothionein-like protein n=1 Tax=Ipomoea pes-caprae TaxID=89656 RepID=A0A223A457_IPOPC|nr:metallothionein [Ipomoea pes-caprae]
MSSGCKCGADCKCGSDCGCEEVTTTVTIIEGVAPVKLTLEGSSEKATEGGHACKCGSNCTCDPCNC